MADEQQPTNGGNQKRDWRLEALERSQAASDEAYKWLRDMGIKHNGQITTVQEDIVDIRQKAEKVPVLEQRVNTVVSELRGMKQALWGAGGSFLVLAGTIVWQAMQ